MLVRILVAAATKSSLRRLTGAVTEANTLVHRVDTQEELWRYLARETYDLVVVTGEVVSSPPEHLIAEIRQLPERPEVVLITDREDPEQHAALLSAGCLAVVYQGVGDAMLRRTLLTLIGRRRDEVDGRLRGDMSTEEFGLGKMVSASPTMQRFLAVARRVVSTDSTLLILGETGVGKEWLARTVHLEGPRATGPFMGVNCAALSESLLESELFGHEKGAFTGATRSRRGYFELAHRGTIFLDEIAELPPHLQVKLLRVLEERRIQPVGAEKAIDVDVRVMAATNRDLELELKEKRFRPDLYYRLNVVSVTLPPLRERREDISTLVESYIDHFCVRLQSHVAGIRPDALDALIRYDWPGNVRELINVVERAVLMGSGPEITLADFPDSIWRAAAGPPAGQGLGWHLSGEASAAASWIEQPWRVARREILEATERQYVTRVLQLSGGWVGEAARRAGMDPRSLYEKMKRLGLRKEDFRRPRGQDSAEEARSVPGSGSRAPD
jgi:DNA-binding NtrC family response regulator